MSINQHSQAMISLKKAHRLSPLPETYEAMVECCLSMQKTREALAITKEMSHVLGSHIRTPICVANVLQAANQVQKVPKQYF